MAVFCKVCGGNKSLHTPELWKVHKHMYDLYDETFREFKRYQKRAKKQMLKRTSK